MTPRYFFVIFSLTLAFILCSLSAIPHNRYIRFQQLAGESIHYMRSKWIYERIHFDQTPIDIAFIGTSHTQSGINSKLVEETLRKNGIDQHVVNFSIPHLGRDLHYLLTRELIENRNIKTIIIELQEVEFRAPHPAFQRLADVSDLISSPLIINTGYFENLVRLPLRQWVLFLHTQLPFLTTNKPEFNHLNYEGLHWDDTYITHGTTTPRLALLTEDSLRQSSEKLEKNRLDKLSFAEKFTLPNQKHSLLKRYNYFYLKNLLDLARAKDVEIVFLYLPFFHGPEQPEAANFALNYGSILSPTEILGDPRVWQNADHLNFGGANRLSVWVGQQLIQRH